MEAQFQIRNQALEMQSYVQDLYNWTNKVKEADNTAAQQSEAPVRGRAAFRPQEAPEALQSISSRLLSSSGASDSAPSPSGRKREAQNAAAHTYSSYADRWGKFDVESALAEVDAPPQQDPPPKEVPGTSSGGADIPPIRRAPPEPETATEWKDKGNAFFKLGNYTRAKECYSSSIRSEATCLGYANRAMARLKLKEFDAAVEDCGAAIQLDPTYLKAYQRRATAYRELDRHLEALLDLEMAARLQPGTKAVLKERDAALAAHVRRVGLCSDVGAQLPWQTVPVPERPDAAVPPPPSEGGSAPEGPPTPKPTALPDATSRTDVSAAAAAAVERLTGRGQALEAPSSFAQFEGVWRSLGGDEGRRASYLMLLDAGGIGEVFKTFMTAGILGGLVAAVLGGLLGGGALPAERTQGIALLAALRELPRFEMTLMCIPGREKKALTAAWDAVAHSAAGEDTSPDIVRLSALRREYGL